MHIYALMLGVSNKNQLISKNHFIHVCLWSLEFMILRTIFYHSEFHPVLKPSELFSLKVQLQQGHCILYSLLDI